MKEKEKKSVIRVTPEMHKAAKIQALQMEMTLEAFVTKLIQDYLKKNK
jgi:predicted HicB family RNase H-like nuclease